MSDARWWWLSFAAPALPKGSQFLGVAIVQAPGVGQVGVYNATREAWRLGINPGGEVQATPLPRNMPPPANATNRLLDRQAAEGVRPQVEALAPVSDSADPLGHYRHRRRPSRR